MQKSITKLDIRSLYKLSLSIGKSFDFQENCGSFSAKLKKYLHQSSCSLWLKPQVSDTEMERCFKNGTAILKAKKLSLKTDFFKALDKSPFLSFSTNEVLYLKNSTLFNPKKGTISYFKISPTLFLLLHNDQSDAPLSEKIAEQLKPIFEILATTLEACLKSERLSVEELNNKKIFEELRQYKMMVENISEGIMITDLSNNIIFLNNQLAQMSGYEKEELLGKNTNDIHSSQDRKNEIEHKIKRTFKGFSDHYELSFINKSNNKEWWADVNVSPFKDVNGKIKGAIGVIRDVTAQKKAESELKENEWKFRNFFEKTPVGIAVSDSPKSIIVNERFCEMLGYSKEEFTKDLLENKITHPEDKKKHLEGYKILLDGESKSISLQKRYIKKNGSIMWGNLSLSLFKDEKTGALTHLAMVEDIHDNKIMSDALAFINELGTSIEPSALFKKTAKYLAKTFDTPFALISELDPEKNVCSSLSFWQKDKFSDFNYTLKHSPCNDVISKKSIHYVDKDIQKKYPKFPALKEIAAESYIAIPLFDAQNKVIGLIALFDTKKMNNVDLIKRILKIFATRLAAEMVRMNNNQILKENSDKLKEAEKLAKIGSWEYNFSTKKIFLSEGIYHIFGWKEEGNSPGVEDLRNAVHPDDKTFLKEIIESTVLKGKPWNIELRYIINGKMIHTINKGKATFENGQFVNLFGTIQDISDKKEAETNLKVATSKYQDLLENINDAVVILDDKQNIKDCNQAAQTIMEYSKSELLQLNIRDCIAPENLLKTEEFTTEAKKDGFFRDMETRIITKNKTYKYVKVDSDAIFENGKYVGSRDIFRDITELKEIEQKREMLYKKVEQANKELKDFAYIVSHDLKAPLRAIGSLSQWISEDYKDVIDKKGQEHLALLNNRVHRMHGFIDGILEYSRLGRIKIEKDLVDINALVKNVLESLDLKNMEVKIITILPIIKCEKIRIYQVFQNLICNSMKYNDKKKGIIKINYKELPNAHQFSIEDNGPGIDKKYHEKIFQIFQTLQIRDKFESTGIGLTIVKRIVELHGGTIKVISNIGKGAKFEFTLSKD